MPDNKKRRAPEDRKRIDINDPDERRNWCKALGVSKLELVLAVQLAGTSARRVRAALAKARRVAGSTRPPKE